LFQAVDTLDEALVYTGAALGHARFADVFEQDSPQLGLPAVAGASGLRSPRAVLSTWCR
jgi:hypothetical protein